MSAKIAEALAKVADLHNQMGEAYTELSALYDVEGAKSGKGGDNGAAGKVPGRGGKAGVASSKAGGKKVTLAQLTAKAKEVAAAQGKEKVAEILGGKVAEVDEDDYAEKFAELEAALEEEELPEPTAAAGKTAAKKTGGKKTKITEDDLRALAKQVIDKHGKDRAVEILGGKLADVDEDDYAEKAAELQAAIDEEAEDDV
jgi:hypothetical protein